MPEQPKLYLTFSAEECGPFDSVRLVNGAIYLNGGQSSVAQYQDWNQLWKVTNGTALGCPELTNTTHSIILGQAKNQ